jgi:hypothetical protein
MPRVVPSDVLKAADQMFPDFVKNPALLPASGPDYLLRLVIFVDLVDRARQNF